VTAALRPVELSRALVRNAPILILDEPTSALDPIAEGLLLDALDHLLEGRTAFVIAHRMSTVSRADQVLVFDGGRIVERGTHEELTTVDGGLYRTYLELQLGGAVPEAFVT
jgi:ABC-type multidrug transport system fused ATPase/permease subunit